MSPGLQARAEDLSSSYLDEPVERNDVADGVGEELENGEVGEDDPVGQPLEEKKQVKVSNPGSIRPLMVTQLVLPCSALGREILGNKPSCLKTARIDKLLERH